MKAVPPLSWKTAYMWTNRNRKNLAESPGLDRELSCSAAALSGCGNSVPHSAPVTGPFQSWLGEWILFPVLIWEMMFIWNSFLHNWTINKRADSKYFHSQWNFVTECCLFLYSFLHPKRSLSLFLSISLCLLPVYFSQNSLELGSSLIKKETLATHRPSPRVATGEWRSRWKGLTTWWLPSRFL